MKPNYGDRKGSLVFVHDALGILPEGGYWIDVNTGVMVVDDTRSVAQAIREARQKSKPDIIDLVRYVRPYIYDRSNDDYVEIDNMQGTTFAIRLDYKNRVIQFAYASCNGENFNKEIGKKIAGERFDSGKFYTIPMIGGRISEGGCLADIYRNGRLYLSPISIRHFEMAGY